MPARRCGPLLIQAAAQQWNVPAGEVTAKNHTLTHAKSGKTLGYGEVAEAAAKLPVPGTVTLKDPKDFRYIGTGKIGLIDNFDITTGKAIYGADTKLDGMLYAAIARPPVYGGTVKSFDDSEAKKVAGVVKIFKIDGAPIPSEFMPLGGRGGRRQEHLGGPEGPRGPQDHLGRRHRTRTTTPTASARSWRRRPASRARSCARRATWTGPGQGQEAGRGRVLRAPPRPGADGAPGRRGTGEGRRVRGLGPRRRVRRRPTTG